MNVTSNIEGYYALMNKKTVLFNLRVVSFPMVHSGWLNQKCDENTTFVLVSLLEQTILI